MKPLLKSFEQRMLAFFLKGLDGFSKMEELGFEENDLLSVVETISSI